MTDIDERGALRASVADFLAKRSPDDPRLWRELADLGLIGLLIADEYGGASAGQADLGVVMEEMGRTLLRSPFLSTAVLVPNLLAVCGDATASNTALPRIATGELIASVAFAEGISARPPEHPQTSATDASGTWRVTGEKNYVLDAPTSAIFYVLARTEDGTAIFAVEAGSGVSALELTTVDQTRPLGRVRFDDAPARLVGEPGQGLESLTAALDRSALALMSEQAGGARHVTAMAADYAKTRYQFGRAIGSFQAVKHMCADMLLESESATSAARHAIDAFTAGVPSFSADLALAQAYCSDAYVFVAATNIQVHGGIGFTWEHPAHLYLRRARADAQLFGPPAWHRERYLREIGA